MSRPAADGSADAVAAPTREDRFVTRLSEVIGGPTGARAGRVSWWTPLRVVLATFTVVFALGLVQKAPCVETDWASQSVRHGLVCDSAIATGYTAAGYAEHHWPWAPADGRYATAPPVGIGYLGWLGAVLTRPLETGPSQATRAEADPADLAGLPGMGREVDRNFMVNALVLSVIGLAAAWFLTGVSRRRPWDAMGFAAAPLLLVTGLSGWDLLAVAFTAGALWSWARGKPLLTGVLVGLGAATRVYPAVLVVAFAVVAVRRRREGVVLPLLGAFVATWVAVQLPALVTGLDQWRATVRAYAGAPGGLGSIWALLGEHGLALSSHATNVVAWLVLVALALAIALLGLLAPRPPRAAQLGFLLAAVVVLLVKTPGPQTALWLLPLAALARPRWRDLLIWQGAELFFVLALNLRLGMTPDGHSWLESSTGHFPAFSLAILVRVAGELWLVAVVVRDVWWPTEDPAVEERAVEERAVEERAVEERGADGGLSAVR